MAGIEGESECTLCHAPIVWRLSVGNRRFPLDATPTETGNVIVVERPDGAIRARILTGPEMPAQQEAFRVHQCPRPTPAGPPCGICKFMMPRDVALAEDWTIHPDCDPEYQRERARQDAAIKAGRSRVIYRETDERSAAA